MQEHRRLVLRVFGSFFLGIIIPAVIAVSTAGFTRQGLDLWHLIMRWLTGAGWCFIIFFSFYSLWLAIQKKQEIEASRTACKEAHRALFTYLQGNSLKGFADSTCQRLHAKLGERLREHKGRYFADFLLNPEVRNYRRYWNEVLELEAYE